ncbi:MAG: cell division protein FtsI (penicillin-binding protein 3) [Woeseiaceae bacterium]|jgi:cell division protein FtsI (penicillin-binding protein 3)|tara:strand:- start:17069 stop:18790 length:1722 start_codon:yes stop_codon:yes gene_type:complete
MSRGAETKEEISRRFIARTFWVLGFFILLSFLLLLRATYLQVLNKDFLINQGNARQMREPTIMAYRGMITDRNNKPLAISTPVDSLAINRKNFLISPQQLNDLSELLDIDLQKLQKQIKANNEKPYWYLKRHVSTELSDKVKALNIKNLSINREYKRTYPAGELVSQILGYTDTDEKGIEGIELQYESWLRGVSGKKKVLKDRKFRSIENIGIIKTARPGKDLKLSIDLRLQYIANKLLKESILENQAQYGTIIVLNALTSEVLAMANQPSFDNNERASLNHSLIRNRAVIDMYEPGSSIKPFIIANAIESGQYDTLSLIDTSPVKIGKKIIKDRTEKGAIDLATILSKSSNAGMSRISLSLESDKLWEMMSNFGFGTFSSGGFPGEARGELHHHSQWGDIGKATMSYGYGISVTPLQLAQAYAILANDGIHRPISLLANQLGEGKRVLSSATAAAVRGMLEKVVGPDGTARKATVEGYRVGGKSGTVWKTSGSGGYTEDRYRSFFVGIAPLDNPQLVVVVFIDEPSGEFYYGGDVAAPVFSKVISESLRLMAIPPNYNTSPLPPLIADLNLE